MITLHFKFSKQRINEREGTWYNTIKKACLKYHITENPIECLKSKWKKIVKGKINKKNEETVMEESKRMSKSRTARNGGWGKRPYINEGRPNEINQIMRMRLHMVQLPCNYKNTKEDGNQCRLCLLRGKIQTEHYFRCRKLKNLRNQWGVQEEDLDSQDINKLLKASKFINSVTLLN